MVAANLCLIHSSRGEYDDAIRYGEMSVKLANTSSSSNPLFMISYTNLADAYVLTGREDEARACIEHARRWIGAERRWRIRCAFLTETAAFALIEGNVRLALDLIAQIETLAHGRENAFPLPGAYWKLKIFRAAHLGRADEILAAASPLGEFLRTRCPFYYLDLLAARAWFERRVLGGHTPQTVSELEMFTSLEMRGKRALLTAQGFLSPTLVADGPAARPGSAQPTPVV